MRGPLLLPNGPLLGDPYSLFNPLLVPLSVAIWPCGGGGGGALASLGVKRVEVEDAQTLSVSKRKTKRGQKARGESPNMMDR